GVAVHESAQRGFVQYEGMIRRERPRAIEQAIDFGKVVARTRAPDTVDQVSQLAVVIHCKDAHVTADCCTVSRSPGVSMPGGTPARRSRATRILSVRGGGRGPGKTRCRRRYFPGRASDSQRPARCG